MHEEENNVNQILNSEKVKEENDVSLLSSLDNDSVNNRNKRKRRNQDENTERKKKLLEEEKVKFFNIILEILTIAFLLD